MAHRVSPQAATDLDDIWYYVAKESGSIAVANHLIDSITDRFFLLAGHPYLGRSRDDDFGVGSRSLCVQRIIHAAVNTSSRCWYAACSYRVIFLKDKRLIAQPIRFLTLRSRSSPRRRDSLPAGWNLTARTGRGRLLPRRPQRGGGFRRRWIRRHSPMLIGRMVVRRRLGSRTQTAIL